MKGVILAGGKGTRLYPLTKTLNKHLLPIGTEPMIYNPLRNMKACGVDEVRVVTSSEHMGQIVSCLGSGSEFGLDLSYSVQDEARGIADALRRAESFVGRESVLVLLGDNMFENPVDYFVDHFRTEQNERGARVILTQVDEPVHFGIAALDERNIIEIQEKPEHPKSNFAVVGAYIYDSRVFDFIRGSRPSARGEYEITTINNSYIELGELRYDFVRGRWMDTGTFESYHEANRLFFPRRH